LNTRIYSIGDNTMTQKWTGDSAYGKNYVIEFKHKGDKQVADVIQITGFREPQDTAYQVDNKSLIESRNLPLNQQEAEGFVEQYLADLRPDEKVLVIERLCSQSEAFGASTP
jgi:hypothetical protein